MGELTSFEMYKNINYIAQTSITLPAQYVDAYVLTGGATAITVTKPPGAAVAIFSSTGNFYVNFNGVAVTPTANITGGVAPELNPVARDISGLNGFSMIAPANCVVTVAYFS